MVFFVSLVLFCILARPAYAYLDPGTGSLLLYALAGMVATAAFFFRKFYYHVAGLILGGGVSRRAPNQDGDLVFYSEGRQYWNVFAPVIEALSKRGVACTYLSSDQDDPGLTLDLVNLTSRYLGGDYKATAYLNNISAKVVVMTTPQLDVLTLRRSKAVQHYAHIVHSPADVLLYKKYAFDYFDSVLCSGPYQMESIRDLEAKRGLPAKQLLPTGCTYYDLMLASLASCRRARAPQDLVNPTVLIAPTWGRNGCLSRYGAAVILPFLGAGFRVVLRPHPQTFKSEPELLRKVLEEARRVGVVEVDNTASPLEVMARADIMVSDISAVVIDYCFLFSRPVLLIDADTEVGGFEAEDVPRQAWEIRYRGRFGRIVGAADLAELARIAGETLHSFEAEDLTRFREQYCYNFGQAGEVACQQIIDILHKIE